MFVVHSREFFSLLKAAISSKLYGYKPVFEGKFNEFLCSEFIHTKEMKLNELLLDWEWKIGKVKDFMKIKNAVEFASRHKNVDFSIIINTIIECLVRGPEFVFSHGNDVVRKFWKYARAVRREYRNSVSFMRIRKVGNSLLGKTQFNHKINDLIIRHFEKRFPGANIEIKNLSNIRSI